MRRAQKTTDCGESQRWAKERRGKPSRVKQSKGGNGGGILRIDSGKPENSLEEISGQEFFDFSGEREWALT